MRIINFRLTDLKGDTTEIPLGAGLTFLHGKTQGERTTTLRLIRFGLGEDADRIDKSVLIKYENVELNLLVNGEAVKVVRSCQSPTGLFDVFDSLNHYRFNRRDMSLFLMEKLGLPKIQLKGSKQGESYNIPLSFYDLARAFVVDRDISYAAILNQVIGQKRTETVRLLMGLITQQTAHLENMLRDLDVQRNELEQQIIAIRNFLKTFNVSSLSDIEQRKRNLSEHLSELEQREANLNLQINEQLQSSVESTRKPSIYEQLQKELSDKRMEFEDNEREILNLLRQQREKIELKNILETELRRVGRHITSQHVISTFTFSKCPRCLQLITQEMQEREGDGECMLCRRPMQIGSSNDEAWQKALRDIRQTIKESEQLLENYQKKIAELRAKQPQLKERVQEIEGVLDRETNRYVSPLVENLRLLASERSSIEKAISQLESEKKQREYANRLQEIDLPKAQQEYEQVLIELETLRNQLGLPSVRYNSFIVHFRNFVQGLITEFETVTWDEKEFMPLINRQEYTRVVSGPDLAITVLAFHYALLAMSVAEPNVKTNHPKLLIIDEPEQQKMGKARYHEVLEKLGMLGIVHRDQLQVIIATATDDIPQKFEQYAFEI